MDKKNNRFKEKTKNERILHEGKIQPFKRKILRDKIW